MEKLLDATSLSCEGRDEHRRQTSCTRHPDPTHLGNAPLPTSSSPFTSNPSSLPTASCQSLNSSSSNITPPPEEELSEHFRIRLGRSSTSVRVESLVRVAQGFWDSHQPTLGLTDSNFEFVKPLILEHLVQQKSQSKNLPTKVGKTRKDVALELVAQDLGLSKADARRLYPKRRIYISLIQKKGPGFILVLGKGVASIWEHRLKKQDVQVALEYQETVLPDLSATAKNLNQYTAKRIIDIMTKYSCKNLEDTAVVKCLNKYLHDGDISTKETPAEPDTPMQLVKEAGWQTAQTFRGIAEFEEQYQMPQSFNGMQMQPFVLEDISTILQPGGFVATEEMDQFYLADISTILQPGGFEATEGMQALISMMPGANAYPLEISSREQPQRLSDAGLPFATQDLQAHGNLGQCASWDHVENVTT